MTYLGTGETFCFFLRKTTTSGKIRLAVPGLCSPPSLAILIPVPICLRSNLAQIGPDQCLCCFARDKKDVSPIPQQVSHARKDV
ncbi:hypothetical protein DTO280E4_1326 [Paecilomyces variotii]|nr:hypothetical protein DTO195F2_6737 [Paecilomyces variotii]KAJ9364546.1 hypothetical protein DTO280E4_1326 [Paecilomyces variotii]